MKRFGWIAAAALAASAPVLAAQDDVTYDEAMKCSALYTVLGGSVEGEPEEEPLLNVATRWLVIAIERDGTEDGSRASGELEALALDLTGAINEFGDDEASVEDFLTRGVDYCAGKQALVAEEFDSVEI